jgi:hypothetical protein
MKSESNIYDHHSSGSLNLDIPNPKKIGGHIAVQTKGLRRGVSSSRCLDVAA